MMESKEIIIHKRWLILYKIGEGSFGQVFKGKLFSPPFILLVPETLLLFCPFFFFSLLAKDIKSNDFYAIKREPLNSPQLYHEYKLYKILRNGRKFNFFFFFFLLIS